MSPSVSLTILFAIPVSVACSSILGELCQDEGQETLFLSKGQSETTKFSEKCIKVTTQRPAELDCAPTLSSVSSNDMSR
jgi:hypothetical protein